ncbi:MAG: type VI secretion system baseplate subunit TssK [Desulfovibrionaceae bacterium]|nr:type VI secretion system baseplate subunit TssK [Desulfovibrionaceae bacterium]
MYNSPPFWEHGVFLQPQHFQLAHVQSVRRLAQGMALINPWLWGVRRLVINEEALGHDIFEVVRLELLLPSGDWALVLDNADLASRAFRDLWTNPESPLSISLGLAPLREQGANVIRVQDATKAPEQYRFTASLTPDVTADLYGDGPEAEVSTMRYNLRLCIGPQEGSDLWKMPLARLVRDGERVLLDEHFAPPCVDINAVPVLHRLVRDVRDLLISRSKQLEEYKIVAGDAGLSSLSSLHGITLFSILGVFCRNVPELEAYLAAPSMHPWPVYRALCRLVGELSVFSASLSPLGETSQGERVLPAYDHEHLYECFRSAWTIISRLVDTLVVGPAFSFVLEPREGGKFLGTVMPKSALANMYAYWLLLRTAHQEGLLVHVQTMGKLASSDDMRGLVGQALPGIRLMYAEQPPAGLPRRSDTLYFMIDQNDPLWQKVLQEGDVAFTLPVRPDDLLAQIVVIQR